MSHRGSFNETIAQLLVATLLGVTFCLIPESSRGAPSVDSADAASAADEPEEPAKSSPKAAPSPATAEDADAD